MTALQKILRYPHSAVFDTSPDAERAFRLRHPAGAAWAIADEVLTVTAGSTSYSYQLATQTVSQLVTSLRADGFEVLDVSSVFANLAASVLVEGKNTQSATNGDHLSGFKSLLWSLFGGYARELRTARAQIHEALRQMRITTASGEWLDLYGALYDQPRTIDQSDTDYAQSIPREAFRVRVNAKGIEKAIFEQIGKDIRIEEPWRLMFRLDVSKLSGLHHMHDNAYYRSHIIQPIATEPFEMDEVLRIIERNRAAGVVTFAPALLLPARHVVFDEYQVGISREDKYTIGAWAGGDAPLGVMRLDNNTFNFNHQVQAYQIIAVSNDDGLQTEQTIDRHRTIAKAAIVLSDGARLGDQNAILSRGTVRVDIAPQSFLSKDMALSNQKRTETITRVQVVTTDLHGIANTSPLDVTVGNGITNTYALSATAITESSRWVGGWDSRKWAGDRTVGMVMTSTPA